VIARRNRLITPATTPIVSTWKITTSATGGVEQAKLPIPKPSIYSINLNYNQQNQGNGTNKLL